MKIVAFYCDQKGMQVLKVAANDLQHRQDTSNKIELTMVCKLACENNAQFHVLETVATARPGAARQDALL